MKENASSEPNSMVYVQASASYPKKQLVADDPSLCVPFCELSGECVEFLGKCTDALLAISNFRFFALLQHAFINIPLMLIDSLEWKGKELPEIFLWCKDGQSFQFKFDNSEDCTRWYERLKRKCATSQGHHEDMFAFAFYAWCLDNMESPQSDAASLTCLSPRDSFDFINEYKRMGFDRDEAWKITEINSKFELCSSYPKLHIVPDHINDEKLDKVAKFRTSRRFPSAVWRNQDNGGVIVRCSQPEVGWLYWRCDQDEDFLEKLGSVVKFPSSSTKPVANGIGALSNVNGDVLNSPNSNGISKQIDDNQIEESIPDDGKKRVLVIDCRSYTAAFANRAKGGGSECPEYYPNCKIQFMGLANIHSIRKSFQSLRELCCKQEEQPGWLASLEATKWLSHISLLIKTSLVVVKAIEQDGQHVVVHCSDGWDRTTQVVALAELLLDPFYRTIKGFRVLLEREWLAFGHKFADRCGHGCEGDVSNERCPVFLQWLDCVHQLLRQFPCFFEFNESFLVKLAHHTYSCLFGTFLCNSEKERLGGNIKNRTCSVWSLLDSHSRNFRNYLYNAEGTKVLYPEYQVRNLLLWSSLYLESPVTFFEISSTGASDTEISGQQDPSTEHAHSPLDFRPTAVRRNSDGDVKSLIASSEEKSYSPGTSFRDDTNSDLYLTKSRFGQSSLEANKFPGNGLILNGVSENSNHISDKDSKFCCETPPGEMEKNVPEGSEEECLENGELGDSVTSSTHTVVEVSGCAKNDVSEDEQSVVIRKESLNSETETVSPTVVSYNGDCGNFNGANSEISETLDSHFNGHSFDDDDASDATIVQDLTMKDSLDLSSSSNDLPYNKIKKLLDVDGLTTVVNPVQARLLELERNYREKIDELHTQLQTQGCWCEPRSRLNSNQELLSTAHSNFDGPRSLSSNATTDTNSSWEHVEENDISPTLWVPDHLAHVCDSCDTNFTATTRKHHCRRCGKVFCNSCCDDVAPVPSEQLYDPVRVCKTCFQILHVPKLHDITVAAS